MSRTQPLVLERKDQEDQTRTITAPSGSKLLFPPPPDADYWTYRVRVADQQAVLGFPKFGSIGIGFAVETDWNTNLPSHLGRPRSPETRNPADKIANHIKHNRGSSNITDEIIIEAITLIQEAVEEDDDVSG